MSTTDASRWRGGYSYTPTPSPPAVDAASATSNESHAAILTAAATVTVGPQAGLSWRVKRAIESSGTPPSAARTTSHQEQRSRQSSSLLSPPPPASTRTTHPFGWSVSSWPHVAAVGDRSSGTRTWRNRRVRSGQQDDTLFAECNPFRTTSTTASATTPVVRTGRRIDVPTSTEVRDETPGTHGDTVADVVNGRHDVGGLMDVLPLALTGYTDRNSVYHAGRDHRLLHMVRDDANVSAWASHFPSSPPSSHGTDSASQSQASRAHNELRPCECSNGTGAHGVTLCTSQPLPEASEAILVNVGDVPSPQAPPPLVLPPLPDTWQLTPAATARALRAWLETAASLRTNSEAAVMTWHRGERSASVDDVMAACAMYSSSSTRLNLPTRRPKDAAAAESRRLEGLAKARVGDYAAGASLLEVVAIVFVSVCVCICVFVCS